MKKKRQRRNKDTVKPPKPKKVPVFVCLFCNHEIYARSYKGIIKEDDYQISNVALNAIINGCPKCHKIDKEHRAKIMVANIFIGVCAKCQGRKYKNPYTKTIKCQCR